MFDHVLSIWSLVIRYVLITSLILDLMSMIDSFVKLKLQNSHIRVPNNNYRINRALEKSRQGLLVKIKKIVFVEEGRRAIFLYLYSMRPLPNREARERDDHVCVMQDYTTSS